MKHPRANHIIILSDRRPIRIADSVWRKIASARASALSEPHRSSWIEVRQHADGRTIVYGRTCGASSWAGGELVPSDHDVMEAIKRVGADLVRSGDAPESIVDECLAAMPPMDI